LIITLVFEKNANFFAENWRNSQKIVIITSASGKLRASLMLAPRDITPRLNVSA
jgi:hypothetical protein